MASMANPRTYLSCHKNYRRSNLPSTPRINISIVFVSQQKHQDEPSPKETTPHKGRREIIVRSSEIAVLGAIFHLRNHNPKEGRGGKKPVSRDEAMEELLEVIQSTKPDNFAPKIAEKKADYVRIEYESPLLGFVDDVEFWFPPGKKSIVQYRSASRVGNFDFDINRKRIKALRVALEKKGWASENTF